MNVKNIVIGVLAVTTIASTSTAIYFGLNQNKNEEEQTQDVQIQEEEQVQDSQVQNEEEVDEYSSFFKYSD